MPNQFLDKSIQNMRSAEFLIQQNLYAPSISRAYYSCLQYIFYILTVKLEKTADDLKPDSTKNTHAKAQLLIELDLAKKNTQDFKWFQKNFVEIKKHRTEADYFHEMFNADSSRDVITKVDSLIRILNNNFK